MTISPGNNLSDADVPSIVALVEALVGNGNALGVAEQVAKTVSQDGSVVSFRVNDRDLQRRSFLSEEAVSCNPYARVVSGSDGAAWGAVDVEVKLSKLSCVFRVAYDPTRLQTHFQMFEFRRTP